MDLNWRALEILIKTEFEHKVKQQLPKGNGDHGKTNPDKRETGTGS